MGTAGAKAISRQVLDLRRKLSLLKLQIPNVRMRKFSRLSSHLCQVVALLVHAVELVQLFAPTCLFAAGMVIKCQMFHKEWYTVCARTWNTVRQTQAQPSQLLEPTMYAPSFPIRVLIVDDDPDTITLSAALLTAKRCQRLLKVVPKLYAELGRAKSGRQPDARPVLGGPKTGRTTTFVTSQRLTELLHWPTATAILTCIAA
jgi:hypothetical protein